MMDYDCAKKRRLSRVLITNGTVRPFEIPFLPLFFELKWFCPLALEVMIPFLETLRRFV